LLTLPAILEFPPSTNKPQPNTTRRVIGCGEDATRTRGREHAVDGCLKQRSQPGDRVGHETSAIHLVFLGVSRASGAGCAAPSQVFGSYDMGDFLYRKLSEVTGRNPQDCDSDLVVLPVFRIAKDTYRRKGD
jgi:hypothetical protein